MSHVVYGKLYNATSAPLDVLRCVVSNHLCVFFCATSPVNSMYKKAGLLKKERRKVHVIVNTKAGARNPNVRAPKGAKVKLVDRRMKADMRNQPARGGAGGRGGGGGRKKGSGRRGANKRPIKLLPRKPRVGGKRFSKQK